MFRGFVSFTVIVGLWRSVAFVPRSRCALRYAIAKNSTVVKQSGFGAKATKLIAGLMVQLQQGKDASNDV